MEKKYLILLLFSTFMFSQKKEAKSFEFKENKVEYTSLDYSKFGIAQFYITIYNDTNDNALIEKNAIDCLSKINNLYHTYYYFLKIPNDITDESEKTELYSTFISHLSKEQQIEKYNIYLNFDSNINMYHLMTDNIKRILTSINSNTICSSLSGKMN